MAIAPLTRLVTSGSLQGPSDPTIVDGKLPVLVTPKAYYRRPSNLYWQLNPYLDWASQISDSDGHVHSNNSTYDPSTINNTTGIAGNATDGRTNMVAMTDPGDSTRRCISTLCSYRDTGGASGSSQRSEWLQDPSTKGITIGQVYWTAFRVRPTTSIRSAGATDELIVYQHHDNHPTANLNPLFSVILFGGGASSKIQVNVKGNTSATPDDGNAVSRSYNLGNYNADQWYTFVLQFKNNWQTSGTPFMKVWMDGVLVVNDTQVNDFNSNQIVTLGQRSYPKMGVYHYYSGTWAAGDFRQVYHKGMIGYTDDGLINEPFMRAAIEQF